MDPLAILQSRIEQLEAKLGMATNIIDGQRGDSVAQNLLNTNQAINRATAEYEKLSQAREMASELNNYSNPNLVENMQQNNMHMQEVMSAEPVLSHHCQCMHRCQQAAPVLESEMIQKVPEMQCQVDQMQTATAEVKSEAENVSQGVQLLAETCGTAAAEASEQLANVALKVEQVEQKMYLKRRNGLD